MARHIAHTHLLDIGRLQCNFHPELKFSNSQALLDHFVSSHLGQLEIRAKFLTGNIISTFLPIMGNTKIGFTGLRMALARHNRSLVCPKEESAAIEDPIKLARAVVRDMIGFVSGWNHTCKFCRINSDTESEAKDHFLKSHLVHLTYESHKSNDVSVVLKQEEEQSKSNNELEECSDHHIEEEDENMHSENEDFDVGDIGIGENDFKELNPSEDGPQPGFDPLSVKTANEQKLDSPTASSSDKSTTSNVDSSLLKTVALPNATLKMLGGKLPHMIQTKDKKRFKVMKVLSRTDDQHLLQVQSMPYPIKVSVPIKTLADFNSEKAKAKTAKATESATKDNATIVKPSPHSQDLLEKQAVAISDPDQFLNKAKVYSCCVYGCPNQKRQSTEELKFHRYRYNNPLRARLHCVMINNTLFQAAERPGSPVPLDPRHEQRDSSQADSTTVLHIRIGLLRALSGRKKE